MPYALLALRTVIHESTGFNPAKLVCEKNLRTSETLLYEKLAGETGYESLETEYGFDFNKPNEKVLGISGKKKLALTRDDRRSV